MTVPSPRAAFWIGLLIAVWSGGLNVPVLLWTRSAVRTISSEQFADTHYLIVRVAATITHVAIYLAILAGVRKLVPPRSPRGDSLTTLATSLSYSGAVIGLMAYSVVFGGLP